MVRKEANSWKSANGPLRQVQSRHPAIAKRKQKQRNRIEKDIGNLGWTSASSYTFRSLFGELEHPLFQERQYTFGFQLALDFFVVVLTRIKIIARLNHLRTWAKLCLSFGSRYVCMNPWSSSFVELRDDTNADKRHTLKLWRVNGNYGNYICRSAADMSVYESVVFKFCGPERSHQRLPNDISACACISDVFIASTRGNVAKFTFHSVPKSKDKTHRFVYWFAHCSSMKHTRDVSLGHLVGKK